LTADVGEQVNDVELVARYRDEPEMFTLVYNKYFRDVYRYVAGRLGEGMADDLAAETFLTAFSQRDRFHPERGGLRPWLFGIASNLVARHRRTEARHYRALARAWREPAAGSHEGRVVAWVAAERVQAELVEALTKLSSGERDVLLLVALGQLNHEEVGQALRISYGTVGSRLSRARSKLRKAISKESFDG
jgi:RNA polymerase sigma factor (sigma-70 family)